MDEYSIVMTETKEIGGYFGLECGSAPLYHPKGIYLNLGRSALRYVIRALRIKQMHIPYYTCHTVAAALYAEKCEPLFYEIDERMLPKEDFPVNDFVLYNNYFGVVGDNVGKLAERYPNLIVDNAQAFYSMPKCRALIFSPRKFFGLPDGGILCGKDMPTLDLPLATSWHDMAHLLKRIDISAQAGYGDFVKSDENMEIAPLMRMSRLTQALMGNIDYEFAAKRRLANFNYLKQCLPTTFPLALAEDDVPMVYPYIADNPRLRARLIQEKIYVASYWPGVRNSGSLKEQILPLPIDQRYNEDDMKRIEKAVNS